jgi:hypothetical protein
MSYGIEFRNADGTLALRLDECFPQLVFQQRYAATFNGTVSIPGFDSNRGMFYIAYRFRKYSLVGGVFTLLANSAQRGFGAGLYNGLWVNPYSVPGLAWNNTTKTMTITQAPDVGLGNRSPYFLKCLHFRKVV